jgi:hypothetical protein
MSTSDLDLLFDDRLHPAVMTSRIRIADMKRSVLALVAGAFVLSLLVACEQGTPEEREGRQPRDTSNIEPQPAPGPGSAPGGMAGDDTPEGEN